MTKEEGSVQLADAAWTLRGACKVSFSVRVHLKAGVFSRRPDDGADIASQ
jgi:hypothetical protein